MAGPEDLAKAALHFNCLPTLRRDGKLPVVLSKSEVKRLLSAPKLLKHRLLIVTLYGAGCAEVRNLKLSALDFDRRMLHVHQGKGGKDRYVPLSGHLIRGLEECIQSECPQEWLLNGQVQQREEGLADTRYSPQGVQWVVRTARSQARSGATTASLWVLYTQRSLELLYGVFISAKFSNKLLRHVRC